jgi:branched-chain amino acid transport system permease protein
MTERHHAALAAGGAPIGVPRLRPARHLWAVPAFLALAALPLMTGSPFAVTIATSLLITAIAAAALHLVIRTGHVSLGHAGIMGVGAYAGTLVLTALHGPFLLAAAAGIAAPAALGLAVGPLVLRLTGKYFVLVTFIVGEILRLGMENWQSLTGGANGIFQIPAPPGFTGPVAFFYLVLGVTTAVLAAVGRILGSEIGRAMDAVRQSERLARCSGIPVLRVKVLVFVLSCGLVGLAGVLQSWFVHFIDPASFSVTQSLNLLVINVIGGMNSLPGTLLGAVFLTVLPELLRRYVELQHIIFGVILIVVMAALPGGLAEIGARARGLLARGLPARRIRA